MAVIVYTLIVAVLIVPILFSALIGGTDATMPDTRSLKQPRKVSADLQRSSNSVDLDC